MTGYTLYKGIPRFPLAFLPTPYHELKCLSAELQGPRLLVKRDDQTGLAGGGNKVRKLEFLLADALQKKCDVLITAGATQSNHCRQTAAAANLAGLSCHLVLSGQPAEMANGNHLLDVLLAAQIHHCQRENRNACMQEVAHTLALQGSRPYVIPIGGSTGLGAIGYVLAMQELQEQLDAADEKVDHIIVASSSGGTQAGLALGARLCGFAGQVLGISIDNDKLEGAPFPKELARIANEAAHLLAEGIRFSAEDFSVQYDYLGQGYGVISEVEVEAICLAAHCEGLLLDPVYTGRAFGALLDLIRKGAFSRSETVLFWHTGGSAALFGYAAELYRRVEAGMRKQPLC